MIEMMMRDEDRIDGIQRNVCAHHLIHDTPRPASNRMFSSRRRIKVVEALRLGSGRGPPVPSSTIFI
jgi:hypothetical protein